MTAGFIVIANEVKQSHALFEEVDFAVPYIGTCKDTSVRVFFYTHREII